MNAEELEDRQYLTFLLGKEEYGIDIMKVMEIRGWEEPTEIPAVPDYVKGVINIRGAIIPIIDLRECLGLERKEYNKMTVVVVVQITSGGSDKKIVGFVVDAVSEVYNISQQDLQGSPDISSVQDAKLILGLAMLEQKLVIILDVEQILSTEQHAEFMQQIDELKEQLG